MKKTFLFLLLPLFPYFANAQAVEKGTRRIGGAIDIQNRNDDGIANKITITTTRLAILPTYGRFVTEKVELGCGLGYQFADRFTIIRQSNNTQIREIEHLGELMLYGKYHFWVADKVAIATRLGFSYQYGWANNDATGRQYTHTAMLHLTPSILWLPSKHLGVEGSFGDIHFGNRYLLNNKEVTARTVQDFGLSLANQGVTLGVHYFF